MLIGIGCAVLLAGCGSSQGLSLVRDAENGNIEAVRQHLAEGADVNATNQLGETALHKSSAKGYGEVVGLLIANGAKETFEVRCMESLSCSRTTSPPPTRWKQLQDRSPWLVSVHRATRRL